MVHNQGTGVPELLEAASLLVPKGIATENDITINDVWDYLTHDEWEVALGLLEEFGDVHPLPLSFWETLATAAEHLQLKNSAAWCQWRCYETRNGTIRAGLALRPASESRRQTPFSGAGVLRPMSNLGNRTPTGEPTLDIAGVWVESTLSRRRRTSGRWGAGAAALVDRLVGVVRISPPVLPVVFSGCRAPWRHRRSRH